MSLTTLANVKAFKNISDTAHDAEITRLIPVVDQFVNEYCNRKVEQATVVEYHSARYGQTVLILRQPPVVSITSIYDDPDRNYPASSLIDPTYYALEDGDAGIVRFDKIVLQRGVNNMKVTYPGGFATGSAPLKLLEQAAIEMVWLARDKGDKALLGLVSKSIADGTVTVQKNDWPAGIQEILDRYRLPDHGSVL